MRLHHLCTLVSIFLDILLISSLVLAFLPSAKSSSKKRGSSSGPEQLSRHPKLSTPEECARKCYPGEPPKICYYHFHLEFYTVLGGACQLCTPNETNPIQENCQCVTADGVERSILTVNRMIPGPSIEVCKGDKIVVDVENSMPGNDVTIHWHGVLQKGSQYYDGVPFVTQCPISEGNTFRYQFDADNAGTHFWHTHTGIQRLDGLYGSLIVHQSNDPNKNSYDEDSFRHVMIVSDWMHEQSTSKFPGLLTTDPGQEPKSLLINGKGRYTDPISGNTTTTPLAVFTIKSGRRYRFRLINAFGTTCPAQLIIQGHRLTAIATDGVAIRPVIVDSIVTFSGERYDFVINGDQPRGAYWIQLRGIGPCTGAQIQQLAILRYEGGLESPSSSPPTYERSLDQGVILNPLNAVCDTPRNDEICITQLQHAKPIDKSILKSPADIKIMLPYRFIPYNLSELFEPKTYQRYLAVGGGRNVASYIDNYSFTFPPSPPLSQLKDIPPETFCNSYKRPANCGENCPCTHRIDIPFKSVVEVILVDEAPPGGILSHPFHLHGYVFNVIGRGRSPDPNVTQLTLDHVRDLDRRGLLKRDFNMAPFKDTIAVPSNGYVIFRFHAKNPGEWLFHCHLQYHTAIGMQLILHVGDLKDLPPVPPGFPTCGNYVPEIAPINKDNDSIYFPQSTSHIKLNL